MLWQEKSDSDKFIVPDDIVDLSFQIKCKELPVDHAWALYKAIETYLPWIKDEAEFAIHSIHGATSGNGWRRPEAESENKLQLSRRAHLTLRTPKDRIVETMKLTHSKLNISGSSIEVGACRSKPLIRTHNIFSRSVCSINDQDEATFTRQIQEQLFNRGIKINKLLCGLSHAIYTPEQDYIARSMLIADLQIDKSIQLQQMGIGPGNKIGCGIFLPHKSLDAVGQGQDDS